MVFQTEREKKEFLEQVNFYKERLVQKAGMTDDDAELKARQVISNLTFILADVLSTFLTDAESTLHAMKMSLSGEDKHRFLLMQKAVRNARLMASSFSRPLYHMKDADDACDCSDWYYHFLRLVETKVTSAEKTQMLLEYLLNMPDEEGIYEESLENFL